MYTEQLTREDLENIYNENQIIAQHEDGKQVPVKYQIHCNGKYHNFDKAKYGYTMYIKDFSVNIGWLHGPVKQQIINNIQKYMANKFEDYASDLYEYNESKKETVTV